MAQEPPQRSQTLWLGTTAAASRMGITTRTLYRFIDEGMLPAYKMGRVIRMQASDVDAYVDACKIAPRSDLASLSADGGVPTRRSAGLTQPRRRAQTQPDMGSSAAGRKDP